MGPFAPFAKGFPLVRILDLPGNQPHCGSFSSLVKQDEQFKETLRAAVPVRQWFWLFSSSAWQADETLRTPYLITQAPLLLPDIKATAEELLQPPDPMASVHLRSDRWTLPSSLLKTWLNWHARRAENSGERA